MTRRPGQKNIPKMERLRAVAAIVTRQSSLEGEARRLGVSPRTIEGWIGYEHAKPPPKPFKPRPSDDGGEAAALAALGETAEAPPSAPDLLLVPPPLEPKEIVAFVEGVISAMTILYATVKRIPIDERISGLSQLEPQERDMLMPGARLASRRGILDKLLKDSDYAAILALSVPALAIAFRRILTVQEVVKERRRAALASRGLAPPEPTGESEAPFSSTGN